MLNGQECFKPVLAPLEALLLPTLVRDTLLVGPGIAKPRSAILPLADPPLGFSFKITFLQLQTALNNWIIFIPYGYSLSTNYPVISDSAIRSKSFISISPIIWVPFINSSSYFFCIVCSVHELGCVSCQIPCHIVHCLFVFSILSFLDWFYANFLQYHSKLFKVI